MSLSKRQALFVLEYGIDHNATQAAIRAGYTETWAKQQGYRLLQQGAVAAAVAKADEERRARLGVDGDWLIAEIVDTLEMAKRGVPRTWQGELVLVTLPGMDKPQPLFDANLAGATASQALLAKLLGMSVERHTVEVTGDVIYTLDLGGDLELGGDEEIEE